MPKSSRTRVIAVLNDSGSPVLPANTSTATGRPAGSVSSPYSICLRPRLPSRECPNAASSQHDPSTHEEDRSNIAIPPSARCRAASFFSISPLPGHQPVHRGIDLIGAGVGHAEVGAQGGVAAAHQRAVDSFGFGRTARDSDQRVGDVPFPARRARAAPQAQLRRHHVRRGHVPVRHRPLHLERRLRVDQRARPSAPAAAPRSPPAAGRSGSPGSPCAAGPARRGRSGAAGRSGKPAAPRPPWCSGDQPGPHASCRCASSQHDPTTLTARSPVFSGYLAAVSALSSHVRPRISYPRSSKFRLGPTATRRRDLRFVFPGTIGIGSASAREPAVPPSLPRHERRGVGPGPAGLFGPRHERPGAVCSNSRRTCAGGQLPTAQRCVRRGQPEETSRSCQPAGWEQ